MSLKSNAETLWTRLLEAMRADGIIAHCVLQSGPATTQIIVETVQQASRPWIPMHMKPTPGKQVVAVNNSGQISVLTYSRDHDRWLDRDNRGVDESCFKGYTFVDTSGAPA
jgi:hypothetical protein